MDWKNELDALVKETMTLAETASTSASTAKPDVTLKIIEAAFDEPAKPVPFQQLEKALSERESVRKRVANFREHQERLRREREDYYARTILRARRLADGVSDEADGR